jgi:hypothetical protein
MMPGYILEFAFPWLCALAESGTQSDLERNLQNLVEAYSLAPR